ncbi:MAG: hypothetical protein MHPSP_002566, partial [Paramarteilia canceri]
SNEIKVETNSDYFRISIKSKIFQLVLIDEVESDELFDPIRCPYSGELTIKYKLLSTKSLSKNLNGLQQEKQKTNYIEFTPNRNNINGITRNDLDKIYVNYSHLPPLL